MRCQSCHQPGRTFIREPSATTSDQSRTHTNSNEPEVVSRSSSQRGIQGGPEYVRTVANQRFKQGAPTPSVATKTCRGTFEISPRQPALTGADEVSVGEFGCPKFHARRQIYLAKKR